MDDLTNADRARWALAAVEGFVNSTHVDTPESAIGDLISNLLHLGRVHGCDPKRLSDQAYGMMIEEREMDPEGEMAEVQQDLNALFSPTGFAGIRKPT